MQIFALFQEIYEELLFTKVFYCIKFIFPDMYEPV